MKTLYCAALVILTLCPGCWWNKDEKPPVIVEKVKMEYITPEVAGTTVAPNDLQTVRHPEAVRAYHTGRYIDPMNPDIMHEASTLYIISESASWNRKPHMPPYAPREEIVPDQALAELSLQTKNLADTNMLMQKLGKELLDARKEMVAMQTQFKSIVATELKDNLQATDKSLKELNSQIVTIKRKIADLEALRK